MACFSFIVAINVRAIQHFRHFDAPWFGATTCYNSPIGPSAVAPTFIPSTLVTTQRKWVRPTNWIIHKYWELLRSGIFFAIGNFHYTSSRVRKSIASSQSLREHTIQNLLILRCSRRSTSIYTGIEEKLSTHFSFDLRNLEYFHVANQIASPALSTCFARRK